MVCGMVCGMVLLAAVVNEKVSVYLTLVPILNACGVPQLVHVDQSSLLPSSSSL